MQSFTLKSDSYNIERFEAVGNVPTNNLVAWMETTQYNAATNNYAAVQNWTPVSSAPSGNFFTNSNGDKNQLPYVKTNVLNGHAVLRFTPTRKMTLNNLAGASGDFTMLMVTRQVGKTNGRFIQGNNNSLFGYWGGRKECYHNDAWSCGDDFWKNSDSNWDIFTIRRSSEAKMSYFNSMGSPVFCKQSGGGLNGLHINTGGHPNEASDAEIAEFILYNTCLSDSDVANLESYLATKWGLLDRMDPNIGGSTNTAAMNIGPVNAVPPSIAPKLPVTNLRIWADASTLPNTAGNLGSNWGANSTTDNAYFFNTISAPKIIPNALNKLPVLEFTPTSVLSNNAILVPSKKQFTLAFVARQMGKSNQRLIVDGSPQGNGHVYGYCYGNKSVVYMGSDWNWGPGFPNTGASDSNWDLYIIMQNYRQRLTIIRNNQIICQGVSTLGGTFNGIGINCNGIPGQSSDGQVAEVLVWDRGLLNSEISTVSTYLIKKWNLQLFLSPSDPLYLEGLLIRSQREIEDNKAAIEQAKKDAADQLAAVNAAKAKEATDAKKLYDDEVAAKKAIADAYTVAQKKFDDSKKALDDAIAKEKSDALVAATKSKEIQDQINSQLDAAKKRGDATAQELINNNILWKEKLKTTEETLGGQINTLNTQLVTTRANAEATLKSRLSIAETEYNSALTEFNTLANKKYNTIKSEEETKLFNRLKAAQDEYTTALNELKKQKIAAQEAADVTLQTSIKSTKDAADTSWKSILDATKKTSDTQFLNLQETSTNDKKLLNTQLANLQDKYTNDINKITSEARTNYKALEESNLIQINDLRKQYTTASDNLIKAYKSQEALQETSTRDKNLLNTQLINLQETSTNDKKLLNTQLTNLQDKYNNDIFKITSEAKANYKALEETDLIQINNLRKQFAIASEDLIKSYKSQEALQETSTRDKNLLNTQLSNLQNKYNTDINKFTTEAKANYKALEDSSLIQINNLRKQYETASEELIKSYKSQEAVQEDYKKFKISSESNYNKLLSQSQIDLDKAAKQYNDLQKSLSESASQQYNTLLAKSKVDAETAVTKYNELKNTEKLAYNQLLDKSKVDAETAVAKYNELKATEKAAYNKLYVDQEAIQKSLIQSSQKSINELLEKSKVDAETAVAKYNELKSKGETAYNKLYADQEAIQQSLIKSSQKSINELIEKSKIEAETAVAQYNELKAKGEIAYNKLYADQEAIQQSLLESSKATLEAAIDEYNSLLAADQNSYNELQLKYNLESETATNMLDKLKKDSIGQYNTLLEESDTKYNLLKESSDARLRLLELSLNQSASDQYKSLQEANSIEIKNIIDTNRINVIQAEKQYNLLKSYYDQLYLQYDNIQNLDQELLTNQLKEYTNSLATINKLNTTIKRINDEYKTNRIMDENKFNAKLELAKQEYNSAVTTINNLRNQYETTSENLVKSYKLEETNTQEKKLLNTQLTNLQNKYDEDIKKLNDDFKNNKIIDENAFNAKIELVQQEYNSAVTTINNLRNDIDIFKTNNTRLSNNLKFAEDEYKSAIKQLTVLAEDKVSAAELAKALSRLGPISTPAPIKPVPAPRAPAPAPRAPAPAPRAPAPVPAPRSPAPITYVTRVVPSTRPIAPAPTAPALVSRAPAPVPRAPAPAPRGPAPRAPAPKV